MRRAVVSTPALKCVVYCVVMSSQSAASSEDYELPDDYEVSDLQQVPIPEWRLEIIRERMAKYEANGFEDRGTRSSKS